MMAELATKADLMAIRSDLLAVKQELQTSMKTLEDTLSLRLTVRLGAMLVVGVGTLAAILKLA